jgi:hypothetical protein
MKRRKHWDETWLFLDPDEVGATLHFEAKTITSRGQRLDKPYMFLTIKYKGKSMSAGLPTIKRLKQIYRELGCEQNSTKNKKGLL